MLRNASLFPAHDFHTSIPSWFPVDDFHPWIPAKKITFALISNPFFQKQEEEKKRKTTKGEEIEQQPPKRFPKWYDKWAILSSQDTDDAFVILRNHPHNINWKLLSQNACAQAIRLLAENPEQVDWWRVGLNPHDDAIELMRNHLDKAFLFYLCQNTNGKALQLVREILGDYVDNDNLNKVDPRYHTIRKLDWEAISSNPSYDAIQLILQYPRFICYPWLAQNPHPIAIQMMESKIRELKPSMDPKRNPTNESLIDYFARHQIECTYPLYLTQLCCNPNPLVLPLIQERMQDLTEEGWKNLSKNPIIFQEYDYHLHQLFGNKAWDYRTFFKERMITSGLAEELMANRFHPRNMDKWAAWGHEEDTDFI